jgi:hypothetical protein
MIEGLPPNIQASLDADSNDFDTHLVRIRKRQSVAFQFIQNENFEKYSIDSSKDEKQVFLLQFIPELLDLVFTRNEPLLKKFDELNFGESVKKWFVELDDVVKEINKIHQMKGVFIMRNTFLHGIEFHLKTKVLIQLLDRFGLDVRHNKLDVNDVYLDMNKRYRRRKANARKNQTGKMDWFEKIMNKYIDKIEHTTNDKKGSRKLMLQIYRGNTSSFLKLLDNFHCIGPSRDKVYKEIWPLLKLILKDEEFLTEDEFLSADEIGYDAKYKKYQLEHVKDILQ